MARSARASIKKINNRRLKKTVFGPAEDARTKRLSEKLLSLASQPKPERIEKGNRFYCYLLHAFLTNDRFFQSGTK